MSQLDLRVLQEVSIAYKPQAPFNELPSITSSKDAYDLFLQHWDKDGISLFEEMHVMLLNRANKVIGIHMLSKGGMSSTVVDLKILFALLLKCAATSFVISHNHPSGSIKPSQTDIDLTRKVKSGAELLDLKLLDHLVLSPDGYYSFADEGHI